MRVVVQQRERFLRDGLGRVLDTHADIDVVGMVATTVGLVDLCQGWLPDVVLLEVDTPRCDPRLVTRRLRQDAPRLRVIGMEKQHPDRPNPQSERSGMQTIIPRGAGSSPILDAIRHSSAVSRAPSLHPVDRRRGSVADGRRLTTREMTVLTMVAGGWTSRQISIQLRISVKTIENHKQKVFDKLGVQNQAHAVSMAMRQGILAPERVVEVSAG